MAQELKRAENAAKVRDFVDVTGTANPLLPLELEEPRGWNRPRC